MRTQFDQAGSFGSATERTSYGITLSEPRPASIIVSELERVAGDIDYWCRGSDDELAVSLDAALHAVHRTIVAVQEAQAVWEMPGVPEHWLG